MARRKISAAEKWWNKNYGEGFAGKDQILTAFTAGEKSGCERALKFVRRKLNFASRKK